MYAGAPAVGVSLWSVGDQPTARLMTDFYRRLLADPRPAPAAALRAARLHMLEDHVHNAPFNWAAFVLIGDWKQ